MKHSLATGANGVALAVYEHGDASAPGIVFIHGWSQSGLCWRRQFESDALRDFHLVAFDLRGHGASDKPLDVASYSLGEYWAEDVAAVIALAGLQKPVLVAWSYGGTVALDYVRRYGVGAIAGVNFVGAVAKLPAPGVRDITSGVVFRKHFGALVSDEPARNIEGARSFVRAFYASEPSRDEFETALAYTMLCPPKIRLNTVVPRAPSFWEDELRALASVPVLITQGERDEVVPPAMADYIQSLVPTARRSDYADAGHCTFSEDAERFNRELAMFAAIARKQ